MPESALAAYAKRVVLSAPPLTQDQQLQLAAVVRASISALPSAKSEIANLYKKGGTGSAHHEV